MSRRAPALAAIAALSLAGSPVARADASAAPARARELTLAECVELAVHRNPDAASAAAEIAATEAARASARGTFGPRLRAEANAVRWDGAFETSLPGSPGSAPPLVVRDATTTTFGASIVQPLTSLWTVYEGYRARDLGVDAARAREQSVRRDVTYQATQAYYRALQTRHVEEIAAKSVEQVESQVTRARSFFDEGAVGRNDVLRAELGLLAQARTQEQNAVHDFLIARASIERAAGTRLSGDDRSRG